MARTTKRAAAAKTAEASPAPEDTALGKATAEAMEQGYVGNDAADGAKDNGDGIEQPAHTEATGPSFGGVGIPGTPGGHPDDPTVGSVVGGARKTKR